LNLNKYNITLICSGLNEIGGYERIIPETANLFANQGHKVTLIILDKNSTQFHKTSAGVNIIHQNLNFGITPKGNVITRKIKFLKDILRLRKTLNNIKSDFIIATEYQFSVALAYTSRHHKAKLISWEHTSFLASPKNKFWTTLVRNAYPKLDAIVCMNENEQKHFTSYNKNVFAIPNFISLIDPIIAKPQNQLLTIARLAPIKGIDLLLLTAKQFLKDFPDWKWKLIGNGELKQTVEKFIQDNNLQNKLVLDTTMYKDLSSFYTSSKVYVCTSRSESFGLTIAEAMSNGLPCVSFDCDSGPRTIIKNEEDGILVKPEDTKGLVAAITQLITNQIMLKRLGENATKNIKRFSSENIFVQWEKLFKTIS